MVQEDCVEKKISTKAITILESSFPETLPYQGERRVDAQHCQDGGMDWADNGNSNKLVAL